MSEKENGMKVPEDVSFIGFDDIEISEIISPSLTTVHVPHRKMGRFSAQRLIQCLGGDSDIASLKLEPNFVLRESLLSRP